MKSKKKKLVLVNFLDLVNSAIFKNNLKLIFVELNTLKLKYVVLLNDFQKIYVYVLSKKSENTL